MTHSQPDDSENNVQNVSLEEIKASAPRLDMDEAELEDNCIICLQAVEDRTVLIHCAHDRMCFECIKKWTEQSRRCPLCNTAIGSHLIHRIRSEYDYQKFFLEPLRTSPPPANVVAEARAGYRARTRRPSEIEQDNLERAVEKRRWVYRHGLFAKHIASNPHTRFRPNPTPVQIASSPELQSRCQMFVRRELRVWPNLDIEFLTSFILSLAKSIDIRTESAIKLISEFLDINGRPSPSGGTTAEHFVHEFYSYLRSPFRDLPAYDAVVQYDTPDDVEPPPPTAPRSTRQNEAGSSRSRRDSDSRRYEPDSHARHASLARGRYEPDDPLDASPRDVNDDSEMDMDEHWIEVPPNRRGGEYRRARGDSPGRDGHRDREPSDRESSRQGDRGRGDRGYEASRYTTGSRHSKDERERFPSSRRQGLSSSRRNRSTSRGNRSRSLDSDSARRERSRGEQGPRSGRSPASRARSSRRHDDISQRDMESDGSRPPSPTRDRKGKRRDYGREDRRDKGFRERRQGGEDEGPGGKGKGRQVYEDGTRKRGAGGSGQSGRGNDGYERMATDNDERRWKDNDAEPPRDNDGQKGRDNTRRGKDDDERGSAFQDDQGKAHRRFSKDNNPSRRGESRSDPDQRPMNGAKRPMHDERPPHSSDDRLLPDDHPSNEPIPYQSTRKTSHEHARQGSHDPTRRLSKRTRSPSPKSNTDRDQKRPAVDIHLLDDSSGASASSANIRPHDNDIHGASLRVNGVQRPRSLSRDAQTRSRSPRRPDVHHNVHELNTSEVERSSTAHHTSAPFSPTSPEVDQTLKTQPGDNRDKTQLGTRQLDTRKMDNRTRAPRLTPLASIRAHLQAPSRPSEPLSEDIAIKGSPTRSTNHLESSATNYAPSAPGPTWLPNAVEKSSKALNDPNTNPIHTNDGSTVSYSILGAAARSQVQPPLITASSDSTQRVCPNSTVGRNRLLLSRLEAIRAATNSDAHDSHLSAKPPASPTLPDTTGNQSATNSELDDHHVGTSQNGQLGADPADGDTPAARFEVERRLKLQARLAARKREINAVMSAKRDPL
ncbi:unnamed protein product [Rhizoctonia solani]|uniref:RING-type E3 ubiquitin transferase n=3 Tax=Rhizoctonia solani TaxID=456999 RepID=A0A8H3HEF8_9AGAM|nr:zinc finger, C3HC4 type (RING finger) protein [Rhizoctonia solani AG-3 Rhs1AP]KEP48287.1 zinc finger, C3HC4 type (RING finger) protein [Rhizoctonia solani 123E]CAE6486341.1 unnamed protein product [Rhizoctonia solani]CAE6501491.1 unnamed protein product [Rhizoctonia solani]